MFTIISAAQREIRRLHLGRGLGFLDPVKLGLNTCPGPPGSVFEEDRLAT